jgi:hypothetical protein
MRTGWISSRPEAPGQCDFLRVHISPGEGLRSIDRAIDHGPITMKLDNFAPTDLPQQPGLTKVHKWVPAITE